MFSLSPVGYSMVFGLGAASAVVGFVILAFAHPFAALLVAASALMGVVAL